MATIERDKPYPKPDEYWSMVEKTLVDVFQVSRFEAADLTGNLRKRLNDCLPDEQLGFYHAEPLDVAADLISKQPDVPQNAAYKSLAIKVGWKP